MIRPVPATSTSAWRAGLLNSLHGDVVSPRTVYFAALSLLPRRRRTGDVGRCRFPARIDRDHPVVIGLARAEPSVRERHDAGGDRRQQREIARVGRPLDRKPVSALELSRHASRTCDLLNALAVSMVGAPRAAGSVVAEAGCEYADTPAALNARTR